MKRQRLSSIGRGGGSEIAEQAVFRGVVRNPQHPPMQRQRLSSIGRGGGAEIVETKTSSGAPQHPPMQRPHLSSIGRGGGAEIVGAETSFGAPPSHVVEVVSLPWLQRSRSLCMMIGSAEW